MFYNFLVFGISSFIDVGLDKRICLGAVFICIEVQFLDFHSVKMILPTPCLILREQGNFWKHAQLSPYIDTVDCRDLKLHASSHQLPNRTCCLFFLLQCASLWPLSVLCLEHIFFLFGEFYFRLWTMQSRGTSLVV